MAINKNALIRYKTIDSCLQNRYRKWTLEDLMEACSEVLYEYEGKIDLVSKRTIQLDIQNMRSSKLYEAPIEVYERKFYRYADPEFSIKRVNVSENDLKAMNDAIQILKQFKDFSAFEQMNGVIHKLEDSVKVSHRTIIHLDKNDLLKGLEHIDRLYQAILQKQVLKIIYKSFKATENKYYAVHPQLLKEYNNRWFLIGWCKEQLMNFALDRIEVIEDKKHTDYIDLNIDAEKYFEEVIGVTVSRQARPMKVRFWVDHKNAPYVVTKPFHSSQRIIKEREDGTIFEILVQLNLELERLLLGYGQSLQVLSPRLLKNRIMKNLKSAINHYEIGIPKASSRTSPDSSGYPAAREERPSEE